MWKNIFIESCVLSALIFGGFYIQSNIIRDEIKSSDRTINESLRQKKLLHISGSSFSEKTLDNNHISGTKTKIPTVHLSGNKQNISIK
jgi:hypothetical protein